MAAIELRTLLDLVGPLQDSTEPASACNRFREYLRKNLNGAGELREYIQAALATKGDSYSFAFQDIVNHIGRMWGFDVQFGRYRGVAGQLGFDGLWRSPTGSAIVVEVKTTDVYTISTDKLLGYINSLVSAGTIEDRFRTLGLYIYGRFDAQTSQLENAIRAERREQELRVISAEALVGLLDLAQEYELEHASVLQVLFPSDIRIDPIVDLILDVVAEEKKDVLEVTSPAEKDSGVIEIAGRVNHFLLPAADSEDGTPVLQNLHRWLGRNLWGLGERTRYRKHFKAGDRFCFYAKGIGVVAEATADSPVFVLQRKDGPVDLKAADLKSAYGIRLKDLRWFDENPIEITSNLRSQLSSFESREPDKGWSWFVQTTSRLTPHDFAVLTERKV